MRQPLSPYCVYTISHEKGLDEIHSRGGNGGLEENKAWITGRRLFLKSENNGTRMPVVFGPAGTGDKLLYYAMLSDVRIDDERHATRYEFTDLTPIDGDCPLSSLTLRSTNKPLSNDFIRPYAICHTPSFVSGPVRQT